ncbi:hypothetical protein L873DRAFT_960409 [Choiromyces venosus 120613-1]|uniref:Uncharacterized protein n=1 Tax=Choiromyces venosus 120613-1 TaxID=1336337 RepID=A0A3N4K3W3_9PEZI|nr:hypothetical protein L873DRAFT_960409 [Choiromyces venosus 120613-1]
MRNTQYQALQKDILLPGEREKDREKKREDKREERRRKPRRKIEGRKIDGGKRVLVPSAERQREGDGGLGVEGEKSLGLGVGAWGVKLVTTGCGKRARERPVWWTSKWTKRQSGVKREKGTNIRKGNRKEKKSEKKKGRKNPLF